MQEKLEERQVRAKRLVTRLKRYYPDAHCALNFTNPLELLVATILSAQCTDERVNRVTQDLFQAYRKADDYARAPVSEIEHHIRSVNFFRNKAKALHQTGQRLVEHYAGQVPKTVEDLVSLPGVGRKTANVVLGNAFAIASGIVVDTHVKRVSYRLGLSSHKAPEKVEADLLQLIHKRDWIVISHLLIAHGRHICKARSPRCAICPLEGDCPQKGLSAKR